MGRALLTAGMAVSANIAVRVCPSRYLWGYRVAALLMFGKFPRHCSDVVDQ
ncbi:MAG: hypothetical protein HQ497_07420 [SAR86 cluster bacterium]|uniref:Uncharacterized protein n=1 Tax=SAR86 cluster bacterium TaxID=2030880 RepID=A0A973A982_9GAMM|nr:hypothetical protein [SAR86 cluster bacterium]